MKRLPEFLIAAAIALVLFMSGVLVGLSIHSQMVPEVREPACADSMTTFRLQERASVAEARWERLRQTRLTACDYYSGAYWDE